MKIMPYKNFRLFILVILWGWSVTLHGQTTEQRLCGQAALKAMHPEWQSNQKTAERFNEFVRQFENLENTQSKLRIPVVVHVMHLPSESYGQASNITDEQVRSQIEVLNEDFNRIFGSRGYNANPVGADTEIEFCLATKDPTGMPTNGIVRVPYAGSNNFQLSNDRVMKDLSRWPVNRYLNMWVVKSIQSGILGYAYLPETMSGDPDRSFIDGLVMGAFYFGSRDKQPLGQSFYLSNTFGYGRTATHEVGHFLNLNHTWGDGGCEIDDGVDDTPLCSGQYFGCPPSPARPIQCGFDRMVENYMDYSDDACFNIFTQGQKTRMRAAMQFYPFRASLVTNANAIATGCSDSGLNLFADTLLMVAGDTQVQRVGRSVEIPLRVRILSQLGTGLNGEAVHWELIEQPIGSNWQVDTVVETTSGGFSILTPSLGLLPGSYVFRASADVLKTPNHVDFTLTALSEALAYPNPFSREIILQIGLNQAQMVRVIVTDVQGRQVRSYQTSAKEAVVLDLATFPDNFYVVTIVSNQFVDTFKVIKLTQP